MSQNAQSRPLSKLPPLRVLAALFVLSLLLITIVARVAMLKTSDAASFRSAGTQQWTRTTDIVAHRGASLERPECTLPAILRAIEAGASAVEVDVRTSSDGQLFLLHDAMLERTTDGDGKGSDRTLAELKQLDAGSWFDSAYRGERIPTLVEAAKICVGKIDLLRELNEQG